MTGPPPGAASALVAPSLKRRMASFVYEGLLLFGIGLIPGVIGALFIAVSGQAQSPQGETVLRVITLAIYAAYFTGFWSRRGQTLPMQTWHIKVVTARGGPLSLPRALLRFGAACAWFAPAALIATLNHWTRWQALGAIAVGVIGYALLALLHPQRQFWHDALCGTRLIDLRLPAPKPAQPSGHTRHNPVP